MFGFTGLALGKYGRVLYQPKLIRSFWGASIGEFGHGSPDLLVGLQAEVDHVQSLRAWQLTTPS